MHKKKLWMEIQQVIKAVDATLCQTKISKESHKQGKHLYSPVDMNKRFKNLFLQRGWTERRKNFWLTSDEVILRRIQFLPEHEQKTAIEKSGNTPIFSYNQTDFVKDRVAVEVQFGKYAFVAHDLFVKHMTFFVSDMIDVGIEILPMKELKKKYVIRSSVL